MLKPTPHLSSLSDQELLAHFVKTNDLNYLGELYQRFTPLVYGLSLKYLNDIEAAQDAVMDIFEILVNKIALYQIDNIKTWLYSVSKNHCLQILRKEKKGVFVEIDEAVMENEDFFTLIDKPQTQEEMDALSYCMGTLSDEQQQSIRYFYIEEKSYADIVDMTGFTLNKVKSYIQNGKRNLKNCIVNILHLS